MTTSRWHSHTRPHCQYTMDETTSNISTRREVVEFRWNTQNTQTLPYWEYWEYMGWKGTERQCGNSPHTSVLMDINNWTPHTAIIFPLEGRLWNFGGTHKIHKRFLTESTGSTWDGNGTERQCGNSPHTSVLMDINNLEIRSLFTKLSLGMRVRRRECKRYTLRSFSLLIRSSSSSLPQKCFLWEEGSVCVPWLDYNLVG